MPISNKRVLFIHHGSHAGGAPLSMLYTMQGMREKGYDPIAALIKPSKELHSLYNDKGFKTIETPWIPIFITWSASEGKRYNPIMWKNVFRAWWKWDIAKKKLLNIIDQNNIDIVHLNSVCLSNAAVTLMENKIPFVWHVREYGPNHKGRRYKFIQKRILKAKEIIFLSKGEQNSWVGNNSHGTVINNFVDFKKFRAYLNLEEQRKKLNLSNNDKAILYVGGMKKHKGVITFLKSLAVLKSKGVENFVGIMPDTKFKIDNPLGKLERMAAKIITNNNLSTHLRMMSFDPDIVKLFALSDVLVFPATKPHFARPIVEAGAMNKPVIASDLKPMDELIVDNKTGFLVKEGGSTEIADRVIELFENPDLAMSMGIAGHKIALEKFNSVKQMKKIADIYARL